MISCCERLEDEGKRKEKAEENFRQKEKRTGEKELREREREKSSQKLRQGQDKLNL